MSTTPLMAWHYTTADCLQGIEASSIIRPAIAGIPLSERPVAWFSLNQRFEPTAAKGLIDPVTRVQRSATIAEMMEFCGGLVRLGVPVRELLTGEALRRKARISNSTWRQLCAAGAACGASPSQWFGFVGSVELARCTVQHLDPSTNTWGAMCADSATATKAAPQRNQPSMADTPPNKG